MRKLLILMLVLGMASMAWATPTITVSDSTPNPGDTIQVYITGTAADASSDGVTGTGGWSGFLAIDFANYSFGSTATSPYLTISPPPTVETAAGAAYYTATSTAVEFLIAAAGTPWSEATDVDTGKWFTYDVLVTGVEGDSEVIDLLDNAMGNAGQVTIDIIPEPMTMALLGLGGLFLRRRK